MIQKTRTAGIAFLAILAVGALTASTASGSQWMTAGNVEATVAADQIGTNVLTIEGNKVECEIIHFTTSSSWGFTTTTLLLSGTTSGCKAFGFVGATVNNECHTHSEIKEFLSVKFKSSLGFRCTGTNKITITASTCTAAIAGEQNFESGITYENTGGSPGTGLLEFNISGISTVKTKDGFLCPFSGTGPTTATLQGQQIVSAKAEGGPVSITAES